MALYEYKCTHCGHEFEVLKPNITNKKEKCPKCNSISEKLISPSTFILKDGGVGWADKSYSNK